VKNIKDNHMTTRAFEFVGAQNIVFKFKLSPEERKIIDFGDYGVPSEARILAVNYSTEGPLNPIQWHTNHLIETELTWGGRLQPHEVHLWPISPTGEKSET